MAWLFYPVSSDHVVFVAHPVPAGTCTEKVSRPSGTPRSVHVEITHVPFAMQQLRTTFVVGPTTVGMVGTFSHRRPNISRRSFVLGSPKPRAWAWGRPRIWFW